MKLVFLLGLITMSFNTWAQVPPQFAATLECHADCMRGVLTKTDGKWHTVITPVASFEVDVKITGSEDFDLVGSVSQVDDPGGGVGGFRIHYAATISPNGRLNSIWENEGWREIGFFDRSTLEFSYLDQCKIVPRPDLGEKIFRADCTVWKNFDFSGFLKFKK